MPAVGKGHRRPNPLPILWTTEGFASISMKIGATRDEISSEQHPQVPLHFLARGGPCEAGRLLAALKKNQGGHTQHIKA